MNLASWLWQTARARPEHPALILGTTLLCDYRGFADLVRARAGRLMAQNIQPGDRVAIYAKNHPDYLPELRSER